jgi:hypothetical protein
MANREDQYAEILRVVGQYLDEQDARPVIEVMAYESRLTASWVPGPPPVEEVEVDEATDFYEMYLDDLSWRARLLRRPSGERAHLFRTIGQELDRDGIILRELIEDETSFTMRGLIGDENIERQYARELVQELSAQRQNQRHIADEAADGGSVGSTHST